MGNRTFAWGAGPTGRLVRVALTMVAGLLSCLAVAGCNIQTTQYGFDAWNYSSNQYVLRLTFQDGTARVVAMPPQAIVSEHSVSNPQQAVVYDATCSRQLTTLTFSGSWVYILVDGSGRVSIAPSPFGAHTDADPSFASPEPVPATCPAG